MQAKAAHEVRQAGEIGEKSNRRKGVNHQMWDFFKPTNKMSSEEIRLRETFEYLLEIEGRLKRIEPLLDELYYKALISNSLLSVRGICEDMSDESHKSTD